MNGRLVFLNEIEEGAFPGRFLVDGILISRDVEADDAFEDDVELVADFSEVKDGVILRDILVFELGDASFDEVDLGDVGGTGMLEELDVEEQGTDSVDVFCGVDLVEVLVDFEGRLEIDE